jgi:branched-chain amino acid aminotransferase
MAVKVFINGTLFDESQAAISVFDRGFLYGDSVYEVTRTMAQKPVELDEHLARLERSADALALGLPPRKELAAAIFETLAAAKNPESYIRIVVTRGGGEVGLDIALADRPNVIVIVKPLALPSAADYRDGVKLALVGVERNRKRAIDPGVKSGNYLNNILALMEAKRAGAYEAIMCDSSGRVAEGSTSNVFCVKNGELLTPALSIGLLAGITRERVLSLAREAKIVVKEPALVPDDLLAADEVFITSSIRGILPARQIDDHDMPRPIPGKVTGDLMARYQAFLASYAKA